jgi:anti-sigma regulatory factor (Ser/Thr protein kinase)
MELVIKNSLHQLERLAGFVESFAEEHRLPSKLSFQINLALEELVTNIISYGYRDTGPHEIRITLTIQNDKLRAEVEDDARPFNPAEAKPPDLDLPLEERPIGGLGIHLAKSMFDTMEYRRDKGKNCLILTKNRVTVGAT